MPTQKQGGIPQPALRARSVPGAKASQAVLGAHRLAAGLIAATHASEAKCRLGTARLNRKLLEDPKIRHLLHGASIGPARPRSSESAAHCPPGSSVLRLYVNRAASREEIGELLHEVYGVKLFRKKSLPYEVIPVRPASFLGNRDQLRPASPGLSCGNLNGELAGTIGFLARGRLGGETYLVSNNHILADVNRGAVGDLIVQPAAAEDGGVEADAIATLFSWVTLDPAGINVVDCAAALVTDRELVDERMVQHIPGQPEPNYFSIGSEPTPAGPRLGKCGRSTDVKAGRLVSANATVSVKLAGRVYVFHNQIEIADESDPFCDLGDSGSLVWNFDGERQPVGLLFARMGDHTYANPIESVLDALGMDVIGH
ncbi:MAG TPA: hypothetical protein VG734_10580 [Lacunisphaera sp.]|nr:hypothetical protein [Lacunisphaera sp.]